MAISPDGAKFHVSEIIGRLGVKDRYEAARWRPEADAAGGRLAALAPLAVLRRVTPAWLPPALAAAILVAATAAVGLLVWGVVSSRAGGSNRALAPTETPPAAVARVGVAPVDRTIDLLVKQDVSSLLDLAQFTTVRCSVEQTVGSPPPCPPDEPDGSPLQAFPIGQCEGSYATTTDAIHAAFGRALSHQPSAAVYAVLRGTDIGSDGYTVLITPDAPSQATQPVSFWYLTNDGRIRGLQFECGPAGAAQQLKYRFPQADAVVGPFNNCSPGPGDTANLMVTVDGLSPGSVLPQFWGAADSTLGLPTGERAVVTVTDATRWTGEPRRLGDVRPGMELEAVGVRQADCTILAETILVPLPDASPIPTP
jgi:hypothetical protein